MALAVLSMVDGEVGDRGPPVPVVCDVPRKEEPTTFSGGEYSIVFANGELKENWCTPDQGYGQRPYTYRSDVPVRAAARHTWKPGHAVGAGRSGDRSAPPIRRYSQLVSSRPDLGLVGDVARSREQLGLTVTWVRGI